MATITDKWYRLQFNLHSTTGFPRDDAVTTTYYQRNQGPFDFTDNDFHDVGNNWAIHVLSAWNLGPIFTGQGTYKWYDMTQPEPRQPIYVGTLDTPLTTWPTGLPHEVALVISWHGTPVSGVKPARTRGRTFLGPLADDAGSLSSDHVRPATATISSIAAKAQGYLDLLKNWPRGSTNMVIYSRGKGTQSPQHPNGTPNWAPFLTPVTGGWVDNEFDTQRRRGLTATIRTPFSS